MSLDAHDEDEITPIRKDEILMEVGGLVDECRATLAIYGDEGGSRKATGYYGNLMPAIAYAVDHHAPGAAEAWARFTGAANFSLVRGSGFDRVACWGVVPR